MVVTGAVIAGVFGVVLAIILGFYWLLVVRPEADLLGRLNPASRRADRARKAALVRNEDGSRRTARIERALARTGARWIFNLRELCDQSGLKINVVGLLALMAIGALAGWFLVMYFVGIWVLAALAAFLGGSAPYWYVSWVRRRRMIKFEELFPEAIDLIARALRAGHALPTGIQMVADELPPPIGTEFRTLYDEQNFGMSMTDALHSFARRIPVLDARFFVTAVLTQREAGGNLAEVLDNLASVIRDRFKVKRQIRVISAHGRLSGWILAGLPPALALVLATINPSHFQQLISEDLGQQMIVTAIVLQVIGTLIMRKILNVEY